jgi:hypothetical protein
MKALTAHVFTLTTALLVAVGQSSAACIGYRSESDPPIDDFEDGVLGPLWEVSATCGTLSETGGELVLTKADGCVGTVEARLGAGGSGHVICGDFDIRVDFDISGWPAASGPGGRFNPIQIRRADNDSLFAGVERYRELPNACVPYADSYKMYTTDPGCQGVAVYIPTSDLVGRFRLVREGVTIRGYYWTGTDWALGMTRTVPTVDVYMVLNTGAHGVNTSDHVSRFDNLSIISPNGVTAVDDLVQSATWGYVKITYR